jgi:hypothetical protein
MLVGVYVARQTDGILGFRKAMPMSILYILNGPDVGQSFQLKEGVNYIGRWQRMRSRSKTEPFHVGICRLSDRQSIDYPNAMFVALTGPSSWRNSASKIEVHSWHARQTTGGKKPSRMKFQLRLGPESQTKKMIRRKCWGII